MYTPHEIYMRRALALAAQGGRAVAPNPLVGAVIVHGDRIIGEGWHTAYGLPHAEVEAIRSLKEIQLLDEATMYVTLEPCSHYGKTPPCSDLLIESGIKRVVIGCRDPFPEVSGRGVQKLVSHGIEVVEDFCRDECVFLNRRFLIRHLKKRPYIILKWAHTSDGFIARSDGTSKWISSEESRALVHKWRATETAIMVGSTTARIDNPQLTVRHVEGVNPTRVLLDRGGVVPQSSQIFDASAETIAYTTQPTEHNSTTVRVQLLHPHAPLQEICEDLYSRGILSIIIEGGAKLLRECIDAELWDEARVFISPMQFGTGLPAPALPILPYHIQCLGADQLSLIVNPAMLKAIGTSSPFIDPLISL